MNIKLQIRGLRDIQRMLEKELPRTEAQDVREELSLQIATLKESIETLRKTESLVISLSWLKDATEL